MVPKAINHLPHKNTGLVSSGDSLTSWGEGTSLALVVQPSSYGATIKMPFEVDVLHRPASHFFLFFPIGLVRLCLVESLVILHFDVII